MLPTCTTTKIGTPVDSSEGMHNLPPVRNHSTSHHQPRFAFVPPERPGVDLFLSPARGLGEWAPRGGRVAGGANSTGDAQRLEELDEVRVAERLSSIEPNALTLDVDGGIARVATGQQMEGDSADET